MASEIGICQMALDHIGARQINSLTDQCQEARACSRLYASARDQVLRDHPWGFAERRRRLALLTPPNLHGYLYAYEYPTDCFHAREIFAGAYLKPIEFRVARLDEGYPKLILTNEPDAILIYTAHVTDADGFDSAFAAALSWRLAADLAMPLTKTLAVQQSAMEIYSYHINSAGKNDAAETHQDPINHFTTFLDARK